jgi:hypothetical protein
LLNGPAKTALTLTAIAPVGLVYGFVAWQQEQPLVAAYTILTSIACLVLCLFILNTAHNYLEIFDFAPSSIEAADGENLGFMILYALPLFTDRISDMNWGAWVPILAISSIIVGTGYGYHFNPLLGLLRWHFYKVTSSRGVTYVLITKKNLTAAATTLKVGQLTEYMLIDLGDKQ